MKYAYRLYKEKQRSPDLILEDEIFPVPDETPLGVTKSRGSEIMVYTVVFKTKEEAERSIVYERYAERLNKLSVEDRRKLLEWDYKRMEKFTAFKCIPELTGVKPAPITIVMNRFKPSARYCARYHALVDTVEKHAEMIKKEVATLLPDEWCTKRGARGK